MFFPGSMVWASMTFRETWDSLLRVGASLNNVFQKLTNSGHNLCTGYYAGYVGSALGFGRFLSAYAWGYICDSYGRKPALVIGMAATVALSVVFGVSTTFVLAVSSRWVFNDVFQAKRRRIIRRATQIMLMGVDHTSHD